MKHVIALSGGKDSTAMALRLAEIEPRNYEYICNETGDELPEMQAHWRKLEAMLDMKIVPVRHHTDLNGAIIEEKMLPNVFRRWCTRILKIEPTIKYMSELPDDSVLYVGLRADEEVRRGLFGEDVLIDFPMRRWGWSEADVWQYLESRGVTVPERTDCARCPFQRLGEWRELYFKRPDIYASAVAQEQASGHTFRSPGRDTWPAALDELSKDFDAGRPLREYRRRSGCAVCSR